MAGDADHLLAAALLQQGVQKQPVFVVCHPPSVVTLPCGVPYCSKRDLQRSPSSASPVDHHYQDAQLARSRHAHVGRGSSLMVHRLVPFVINRS